MAATPASEESAHFVEVSVDSLGFEPETAGFRTLGGNGARWLVAAANEEDELTCAAEPGGSGGCDGVLALQDDF